MLYAIYLDENGLDSDLAYARASGLMKGEKYLVENVSMGQSYTSIYLDYPQNNYNSIMFDFVDEEGNEVNIYDDQIYNPYI